MTVTLTNVGDIITVLYQACSTSEFGYETDWEAYVDLTVTAEMLDSWERWGSEYKTFEDMVLKVHHDEVQEALEVSR